MTRSNDDKTHGDVRSGRKRPSEPATSVYSPQQVHALASMNAIQSRPIPGLLEEASTKVTSANEQSKNEPCTVYQERPPASHSPDATSNPLSPLRDVSQSAETTRLAPLPAPTAAKPTTTTPTAATPTATATPVHRKVPKGMFGFAIQGLAKRLRSTSWRVGAGLLALGSMTLWAIVTTSPAKMRSAAASSVAAAKRSAPPAPQVAPETVHQSKPSEPELHKDENVPAENVPAEEAEPVTPRQACDLLLAGQTSQAESAYQALIAQHPNEEVYRVTLNLIPSMRK